MHVTNFYLHGTVRPVPIPTVCLQLNSLFLYFITIVHVRMYYILYVLYSCELAEE